MAIQVPFPIPSTGYALNSKLRVNLDFIVSKFNEFNTGTATWDQVSIGTANNLTGVLTFYNSSNANYLAFQPGVTGSSITYTLPIAVPGGDNRPLVATAAGVMSWGNQAVQTSSSPTFVGLTLSGLTGNLKVLTGSTLQTITELDNSTGVNAMLRASSAGSPKYVSLLGTSNRITVTHNTNDTTLDLPQDIHTTASPTFTSVIVGAGSTSSTALKLNNTNNLGINADASNIYFVIGGTNRASIDDTGAMFATGEVRGTDVRGTTSLQVGGVNKVTITSGASASYSLVLPTDDGSSNQVLTTDGSGNLSWATPSGTGANTALSNLASVAINTSLISDTTNTDDLGSSSIKWRSAYFGTTINVAGSTPEIIIDSSGDAFAYIDRGATTNEAILKFATAGTNKAGIGLDNDSTDDLRLYTNSDFGTPLLTLTASDVYTTAFTDYSGTSTVTGWSSFTTKEIYYKKVGKTAIVWFRIIGTSDATTASFTIPLTNSSIPVNNCTFVSDNGTPQTTGGRISLPASSSTISIFSNMASQAWTNSGTKQVGAGFIIFQTA